MVQLPNPGKFRLDSDPPRAAGVAAAAAAMKVEIEDFLDEEHGPFSKKSRNASLPQQQGMPYNILDEPSPLGLRLRKSPSLLDLIQMRLSQVNSGTMSCILASENADSGKKIDFKFDAVSGTTDKLKASNFPAILLRIGTWERESKYEGDLVAKIYFAKHKLVWEVLEGGLKSKIEIQWSDISDMKARYPENGDGTLDIVLARPPLFYKETDPQPRKHTLWQATTDFTGGQASVHRRHFLKCPQSLLSKNVEKLLQCDPRLNLLSQQPDIILESPYFELRCAVFDDQVEAKSHGFDNMDGKGLTFSGFCDSGSPHTTSSTSMKSAEQDSVGRAPDRVSQEIASPSTGIESQALEEHNSSEAEELKELNRQDQLSARGPKETMSSSHLVNCMEKCTQMASGNPSSSSDALPTKEILENISQQLLDDSQGSSVLDEQSLLPRVNSLLSLITPQSLQVNNNGGRRIVGDESDSVTATEVVDGAQPSVSRNESYGELLINLPRIASLPQFLSNIYEDFEDEGR
ncbi:uncharacterized protein LOC103707426 isoform X2 [Phoenix dactylifera]|uniref:Uncharacterized protein LOC103707426 isoform X2 n=1 Tax=Phoenix dactylifera TaxID=42345 RepID=A0A8B9A5E7_PHODC|nr:uncharacterized protein LOC103707426 isoform X2 [Phoenix dactylifera]